MTKQEALDFLGITKWHKAGYRGQGIHIMSDEKISEDFKSSHTERLSEVICPSGYDKNKSCHGKDVMIHILMTAPEAQCTAFPLNGNFSSNSYSSQCVDYILENDVDIFTTSKTGGYPSNGEQNAIQDCIANGCIFFGSAGNSNEAGIMPEIRYEGYWAIGGVKCVDGVWEKVRYSSVGEELDFVTIAEILGVSGTSFCAPVFAGMCGLVQQFFKEQAGRKLTRSEMERFIKDNLIDVDEEGFDIRTGHGLFILPDPESVDVSRYISDYKESKKMILKQKFIDKSKYSLKCPYSMNAEFVVVHNTANDASAKNEVAYMESINVSTSFHIAVDDVEAIQAIPFDRNAFHAGDGVEGNGNRKGIAIEICYSKSGGERFEKAKSNAVEVITDILIEKNWDITHVKKHQDFSSKYCPHRILDEGWEKFINQIQNRLEEKRMEDANKPSEWAKGSWEWGTKNGVCDGTNPKGTITREQVVQMLYNLLVKGGK